MTQQADLKSVLDNVVSAYIAHGVPTEKTFEIIDAITDLSIARYAQGRKEAMQIWAPNVYKEVYEGLDFQNN